MWDSRGDGILGVGNLRVEFKGWFGGSTGWGQGMGV